LHTGSNQEEDN